MEIRHKKALSLKNISLSIPIAIDGQKKTLKNSIISTATGGRIQKRGRHSEIIALKDITVDINRGERVALIGHNGAGKSTFLRLISGIYEPTKGEFINYCDVYPMLQKNFLVGPELSGAQAIKGHYLLHNKNLKGFDEFLQEVTIFSELEDYIDLPMKSYSEGMAARLLFSILTSSIHDCLALDEGFGTGDARFYERASERLKKFIDSAGTLVLASHSDDLLRKFCNRGLVFKKGAIAYDGKINKALDYYHEDN